MASTAEPKSGPIPLKPNYPYIPVQPRQKPMQVLVLGLSRTGTMSTYAALSKLGLTTYHALEMGLNNAANRHTALWVQALDAKYKGKGRVWKGADFDRMLWRYDAVTDIPCVLFADELLEAYPEAKVVLTNRSMDGWLRSVDNSFYAILLTWPWFFITSIDWRYAAISHKLYTYALSIWTGGDWRNKAALPAGYARHYEHVRAAVPKERLLEFSVKDGWEPLCQFLGKDVPAEPFPYVNGGRQAAELHEHIMVGIWARLWAARVLKRVAVVGVPVAVGWAAWWWRGRDW